MSMTKIDLENWNRKDIFNHFAKEVVCATSITQNIDVTGLVDFCNNTGRKFYITFLYCVSKVLNNHDEFKMEYLWKTDEIVLHDKINPKHNIFHEDTETFTAVVSEFDDDYEVFYNTCVNDIELAKNSRNYILRNFASNNFDASYVSWLSYNSVDVELPNGYIYLAPIINWGRYKLIENKLVLPLTMKIQHSVADGFHIARFMTEVESLTSKFSK